MKSIAVVTLFAALIVVPARGGWAESPPSGKVLAATGESFIFREGAAEKIPLREGAEIYLRDRIETGGDAKVKIMLRGEVLMIIDRNTTVEIEEHVWEPRKKQREGKIGLLGGRLRTILEAAAPPPTFSIYTANTVAGIKGTDVVVENPLREKTTVLTLAGLVEVRNADPAVAGAQMVKAGYLCEVVGREPPREPRPIGERRIRKIRDEMWLLQPLHAGVGMLQGAKPLTRDRDLARHSPAVEKAVRADVTAPRDNPQLDPNIGGQFIYPSLVSPKAPAGLTGDRGEPPAGGVPSGGVSITGGSAGPAPPPPRDMGPEFFGGGGRK